MCNAVRGNPTKEEHNQAFGGLEIIRMAPGDQRISIDFAYHGGAAPENLEYELSIKEWGGEEVRSLRGVGRATSFECMGLNNGVDYRMDLMAVEKDTGELVAKAPVRLFRTGWVPGVVINYIHPEDYTYNSSGRSPASPSLVRLPDGRLLASHDIYWGEGGQNLTKVFVSEDEGNHWRYLSDVYPCFWGKLFIHQGRLYILGTTTEYGALVIFRSEDGGRTWSSPASLLEAGSREKGGPHKAPMPVVEHHGRLWTAIDYGSWGTGGHASGVISIPVDADLMDAENWTVTPFLPYDSAWPGAIRGGNPGLLEGNVVVTPEGTLVNFLRYHTDKGEPDYGKAILLQVDQDRPSASLCFGQVVDFPGNMSKFTIQWDAETKRYYSLVNRVTTPWVFQRNILTLVSSPDLVHWEIERDVLNYQDNQWPEDHTKVGFQYVDWILDGDTLLAASRTALNGACDFHNANYLTFHRFRNFYGK